jgi:hypothetical protein
MGIGLWLASTDVTLEELSDKTLERIPQLRQIQDQMAATAVLLRFASALQFGLAAALLALTWLRSRAHVAGKRSRFLFGLPGGLALLVLVTAMSAYLVASPVRLPQLLGTTAIFLMFVILLAFVAGTLTAYFDRHGIPAVTILLLLAALFSAFDWNDNHLVRMEKLPDFTRFPKAKDAFKEWLSSREDREYYKSLRQPYPVFLVTAAGGGLYAAHHAATVLARLQDRCPSFAQHVFAVSAVSGGSLGAATFVSLASRFAENGPPRDCTFGPLTDKGDFERRTHKFLEGDFLAPVVAAGLFPDLLQRLIPYPIGRFDRARALEASFELAWARAAPELTSDNPFAALYFEHFQNAERPAGHVKRPKTALILNTTDVEHGYRAAVAPFRLSPVESSLNPSFSGLTEFHELIGKNNHFEHDVRLSTAVGLSSRFPWLLPAGLGRRALDGSRFRLLDGALFENSGIETANDLIAELGDQGEVKIHLIYIAGASLSSERSWQGMGETLSPIRALLGTRAQRGSLALYRSDQRDRRCAGDPKCAIGVSAEFPLNLGDFRTALGWQLSPLTRRVVELHGGNADRSGITRVNPNSFEGDNVSIRMAVGVSDVSACKIASILTGAPRPGKRFCEK